MTCNRPKYWPKRSNLLIGVIVTLIGVSGGTVSAQPAPTVATTLRTTSTSATSVCVGSSSTSCASATGGIKAGPIDVSLITSAGAIGIASSVPADTSFKLYNNSGTLIWNGIVLGTGASLSGTSGKLAKFTAANAVGDSICSESGATLTCVNTISATSLAGTLTTASQPNVTAAAALVTVGTIGTGVWQGTKVGLAYGGTNADLSATGGTSQFLRQNSVGAAVTVVRPAVSDLSDAANVALLNAANAFTDATDASSSTTGALTTAGGMGIAKKLYVGTGFTVSAGLAAITSAVSAGADAGNLSLIDSTAYGTGVGGGITFSGKYTSGGTVAQGGAIRLMKTNATDGNFSFDLNFSTRPNGGGVAQRWGINDQGDWTFGASSHIADSVGTPSIASGFGNGTPSVSGTDYAMHIIVNGSANTTGTITFGHTWSTTPVCVASSSSTANPTHLSIFNISTTGFTLDYASTTAEDLQVLCRGY